VTESPKYNSVEVLGVGASSTLTSADEVRRVVLAGLSKPPDLGPLYRSQK
jgi:hypothetical protein